MPDHYSDVAEACRRAEQEAIAAIRADPGPVAAAHQALSLLHTARAQDLIRLAGKTSTPTWARATEAAL